MTPGNFNTLNAILGLRDWAIDAECDERDLADIAAQISKATGVDAMECSRLVASLHATARALVATGPALSRFEGRA